MTAWTGVNTILGWGMDKTGYRYGQNWTGVWTILPCPVYSFLHIYNGKY